MCVYICVLPCGTCMCVRACVWRQHTIHYKLCTRDEDNIYFYAKCDVFSVFFIIIIF